MAAFKKLLHDAVVARINTVWTVSAIYRPREIARIPFDNLVSGDELPVAVIDYDLREAQGRWPVRQVVEEGTVTVYYLDDDDITPDALDDLLDLLRDDLLENPLTYGQRLGNPYTTQSADLPVNRYFLNATKPPYAGAVVFRVQVGYTRE